MCASNAERTAAFVGTPLHRKRISTLSAEDFHRLFSAKYTKNGAERKPDVYIPTVPKDDDSSVCQCGAEHFSPRMARVLMPVRSMLASHFVLSSLPKPVEAKTDQRVGSFEESVARFFPGAKPSSRILSRVLTTLRGRKFTASNTLFGTSICPDEINSKPSKSLSTTLQQALGKQNGVFSLGGLGGLPFVGKTGMGAFLSHCPQQGKVFIFFGPHVGITAQGAVGKVERMGRSNPSSACGAVVGAYNQIRSKNKKNRKTKNSGTMDYQEEYIVSALRPKVTKTANMEEDEVAALLATQMYSLVVDMLMGELEACWESDTAFWDNISEVTIFGGLLINRGANREDYFQPVSFETWTKPEVEGAQPSRHDLYQVAFSADPPSFLSP